MTSPMTAMATTVGSLAMNSCVGGPWAVTPMGGGWGWRCCSSAESRLGCRCSTVRPRRRPRRRYQPSRGGLIEPASTPSWLVCSRRWRYMAWRQAGERA